VAIALFDHGFRQTAEEAFNVRLAHKEVERELDDFGLHLGEALGAPTRFVLAKERGTQHLGITRRRLGGLLSSVSAIDFCSHDPIIEQLPTGAIVQKSQIVVG
jgi:hypothetical protein